jgi:hypothetical protein
MTASEAMKELYSHLPEKAQLHYEHDLGGAGGTCKAFDWSISFVGVSGKVCLTPLPSADVKFKVLGVPVSEFKCDLAKDCCINLDVGLASGNACLFIKNSNELWIELHASVIFNGSIDGKYKILSL